MRRQLQNYPFVKQLLSLIEVRKGARANDASSRRTLAELRGGLGKPFGAAPLRDRFVLRHTDDDPDCELEWYALVASLFAMKQGGATSGKHHAKDISIGRALRDTLDDPREAEGSGVEKRLVALLNSDREDLPHRLRQVVSLLKSKDKPFDYHQLLYDLLNWNGQQRRVQTHWARDFWGGGGAAKADEQVQASEAVGTT
ncbi:type I-E CRISPR-associated protein Cse2/CasB [Stratiformator vulcanicus]|uniref:CRISPR-associated protein Cse2 n=1 Tax=Stratiformator vulcanicus TaxID=2527980 RepID=A0A517R122_9PLAN|nr:type I-E CRISPR-associated protein Cse2/CasB [Stratiformator vulcanicus]QDT37592.1 CRISPR-associated protein Cse2 [Stratiformator vulcanicus]